MTIKLVIDTNIALDLLVFADPGVQSLRGALEKGQAVWIASMEMRAELARVLDYPRVVPRLVARGLDPMSVLTEFDQLARIVEPAPTASCLCADADDQRFIDLAVQHGALLLSKDAAVLALLRPMRALGANASAAWRD